MGLFTLGGESIKYLTWVLIYMCNFFNENVTFLTAHLLFGCGTEVFSVLL